MERTDSWRLLCCLPRPSLGAQRTQRKIDPTVPDQIQRHDKEFDKTKGDTRADAFKMNARMRLATAKPRMIVGKKRSQKAAIQSRVLCEA
jgi:hypothetical protein